MPTGRVKFYDARQGVGFVFADDEGGDVFVPSSALPEGVTTLKGGTRTVRHRQPAGAVPRPCRCGSWTRRRASPSTARSATASPTEEMVVIVEDVIKLLDDVSTTLRRGHYPDKALGTKVAQVLRAVAGDPGAVTCR